MIISYETKNFSYEMNAVSHEIPAVSDNVQTNIQVSILPGRSEASPGLYLDREVLAALSILWICRSIKVKIRAPLRYL
jgi:hypothetical protein